MATENNYAAKENELQQQIDNIESTHPGYDEYRYDRSEEHTSELQSPWN